MEPCCGKPATIPDLLDSISAKVADARSMAEDTAVALDGPPPPMPCDAVPAPKNPADSVLARLVSIDERMNQVLNAVNRARRVVMP